MKLVYTESFYRALRNAPPQIRKAFNKQVLLLEGNLRHPSLQAKKYDEKRSIWQGRVNRSWRFYFLIKSDAYVLLDIIPHPK